MRCRSSIWFAFVRNSIFANQIYHLAIFALFIQYLWFQGSMLTIYTNDDLTMFRLTQIWREKIAKIITKVISPQNIYISAFCLTIHFLSKNSVLVVNQMYLHMNLSKTPFRAHLLVVKMILTEQELWSEAIIGFKFN